MTMTPTCQCDILPDRPCPDPITQEDLLCDACRESQRDGMMHATSSLLAGEKVVKIRHLAISTEAVGAIFSPEAS